MNTSRQARNWTLAAAIGVALGAFGVLDADTARADGGGDVTENGTAVGTGNITGLGNSEAVNVSLGNGFGGTGNGTVIDLSAGSIAVGDEAGGYASAGAGATSLGPFGETAFTGNVANGGAVAGFAFHSFDLVGPGSASTTVTGPGGNTVTVSDDLTGSSGTAPGIGNLEVGNVGTTDAIFGTESLGLTNGGSGAFTLDPPFDASGGGFGFFGL